MRVHHVISSICERVGGVCPSTLILQCHRAPRSAPQPPIQGGGIRHQPARLWNPISRRLDRHPASRERSLERSTRTAMSSGSVTTRTLWRPGEFARSPEAFVCLAPVGHRTEPLILVERELQIGVTERDHLDAGQFDTRHRALSPASTAATSWSLSGPGSANSHTLSASPDIPGAYGRAAPAARKSGFSLIFVATYVVAVHGVRCASGRGSLSLFRRVGRSWAHWRLRSASRWRSLMCSRAAR